IGGSPFAIEERGDPPIAIGWPLIYQPANDGQKLCILGLVIGAARLRSAFQPLVEVGTGYAQRVCDGLHREPSFGNKIGRDIRLWNGPPLSPASVMMLWCEERKERAYEHNDPWN